MGLILIICLKRNMNPPPLKPRLPPKIIVKLKGRPNKIATFIRDENLGINVDRSSGIGVLGMDTEKILLALEERNRWKERELELREAMKTMPRQEKRQKHDKLELIKEQVAYYEALARDMKKSVQPSNVPHLLNSLIHW